MYRRILKCTLFCLLCVPLLGAAVLPLKSIQVDTSDSARLQRGAKWYMNYCAGCHSLKYMRYTRMAKDLNLVDFKGEIDEPLLQNNLVFTTQPKTEGILTPLPFVQARQWFGVIPKDLSLVARVRGANWLYTYLTSFYQDSTRPFGSNNLIFKDVAMPNVLAPLQGEVIAVYGDDEHQHYEYVKHQRDASILHLQRITDGQMSPQAFDSMIKDIVHFLVYVAEPVKETRYHIGFWVLGFLVLLIGLLYALKLDFMKKM